jgi:tetratricopeptide (TPR) repeat protein/transcriptional regulator with XRE-family HTH domain
VLDESPEEQAGPGFGGLLRRLRDEAGLTQDELAGAAQVSQRAISDLERGINRTARKDTALLLAGALGLDGVARELFVAAARGRAPAGEVLAAVSAAAGARSAAVASRTLPRDVVGFTGRQAELEQLAQRWPAAADGGVVGIHAIGGMAGIGKTAFAVHAAHQLAGNFPDGQFFLPLHAHAPGQRPVSPADALASLLLTAGVAAAQIPPGTDARAARWRDLVAGKKILLVLDDAAGHEQVRPLLPGTPGSLVLITSRRRLAALEDAAVVSLDTLTPPDAAGLLARLAGRPDVTAGDSAVGQIAARCGYLPLAIGMIGRQLAHHPAWTPAGLAHELAAARDRLELMAAENLSVAAAFGLSYQDLPGDQQRLFRRLGLHPGPDIDVHAAAALDDTGSGPARRGLLALYDQHLLTEPSPGRYRLHDLLREHARALASADDAADRAAAVGRLLDYYTDTALAASTHVPTRTVAASPPPPGRPPPGAPPVATPRQAEAWLQAERANLHAVDGYAINAAPRHAIAISAAMAGFLEAQGHWDQAAALHQGAVTAARHIEDRTAQARALNDLGTMHGHLGDYQAAIAIVDQALALYRELGDRAGQACALNHLGVLQHYTGQLPAAMASHRRALELFGDLGHRHGQGDALNELGTIQMLTGGYPAAAASLRQAIALLGDPGHRLSYGDALNNLASVQLLTGDYPAAAATQQQALKLFRDLGDRYGQAHVLGEMGTVQRLTGDHQAAAASQQQALKLFRDLGSREDQAWILNELGVLQQLAGDYPAAAASHQQALDLSRAFGGQLGQAEALNSLGELLSRSSAGQQARDHHTQALAIARDLGAPQEEARALEAIGRCDIQDGHPAEGATRLREALAIYQRIGAPDARRVEQTLRQHGR